MTSPFIAARNSVSRAAYKGFLKPLFFRQDPEEVHERMVGFGAALGKNRLARAALKASFGYQNPVLEQRILGIDFKNPVGLAAGFDKEAELIRIIPSVGFGWMEVGSITARPCPGNPKPRLWRLPASEGLVVHYGLKNGGCDAIKKRLQNAPSSIPLGTSIAMTNCEANMETDPAIKDYAYSFRELADVGDYFTVNISCPNAIGGQPFMEPDKLERLLSELDPIETKKPVFVKLSPDLSRAGLDAILEVLNGHRIHGIITTNLTKNRDNSKIKDKDLPSKGGISGQPVKALADDLLSYIYQKMPGRFVLVGCGGVRNADDAYAKIRRGADLLQMVTGMIFEGPQVVSEINRGLVELLKRDGFKNIGEAIGIDNKI